MLALAGAALGVACAAAGVTLLLHAAPIDIPRLEEVAINARALGFAIGVTLSTVLLFGMMPALFLTRTDLQAALKTGGRGSSGGGNSMRRWLVSAEVGLAVMLLVAAGLLVRSVQHLVREDPGFDASDGVTASVELSERAYPDLKAVARLYGDLGRALKDTPEVTAGLANVAPLSPGWRIPFLVEGRPRPKAGDEPTVQHITVDESFFAALGVPLVHGRWFTERDDAETLGVVLINQTLANSYWPSEDPIGRHIISFARQIGPLGRTLIANSRYEIVGVVADVKNASLRNSTEPAIFYPQRQFPFRNMHLVARGPGGAERLTGLVRGAVRQLDSGLPLSRVTTLDRLVGDSVDRPRLLTDVMSVFAALALTLSALGIYGVLSYSVSQRRQELSVRMALGAEGGAIVWLVVRQGLALAATGLIVGAAGGYTIGRLLGGLLYGVTPADPATFAAVLSAVGAVALAACLVPARRAATTDLLGALRGD